MHLVVGLGNPGPKYSGNRHNVGFMVVDRLAARWAAPAFRDKFKAETTKGLLRQGDVVLLKPQTFMNLSGESVQPAMAFYKVDLEHVLCVHDELDLEFGVVRLKVGGGTAGHNGLKSMVQRCGGNGFARVRVGIGRPPVRTESHVLSDFDSSERAELGDVIERACDMVEACILEGATAAMNRYHGA
ncbi:MAG: aminoacyl-tRNA hydrolase [Myxococcales bacterium]|nr:aminoacyl-tRNA hydrolase [Myxococcales bacterium]MCB9629237.1 aminoacyl-tRNA hydrolase [Sandaracinaceae bacterium]